MYKSLLYFLTILIGLQSHSQTVRGMVADDNHERLIGATVLELGTMNGITTDVNGQFELEVSSRSARLIISFIGFQPDTLSADFSGMMHIILQPSTSELEEVMVTSGSTFLDDLESKHVEVITAAELAKAACCNLSESFETNASVDVSFTDAVTGAKTIRMLGLDGRYVQINRENTPHVRGLSGRYGLSYVPGTWIQSIDLGKGAGTVVNGYESMTGQINVELKKPELSEKLYLNGYGNSLGRVELNANTTFSINDNWNSGVLFHSNHFNNEVDRNDDGFMDLPKSKQINVMNRYKYRGEKLVTQIGFQFMRDEKAGGQLGFEFGDDFRSSSEYGFVNNTSRFEVFGKTGLLFPHKPYKGWGFIYSATTLDIDGGYGEDSYEGKEATLYGNVIFQNIIGNSFHQYKTGVSILYDNFDEVYADSAFTRKEIVPGAYFEYTYLPSDQFTIVAGVRSDFHNLYGTYFTPRLHLRYQFSENTTIRGAIGKGYRTPNAIVENSSVLVSNRQLIVQEDPKPEISWNMGTSLVTVIPVGEKKLNIVADYFYTAFDNQLIYDMDQSSTELNIYNLDGESFAHSFQIEGTFPVSEFLKLKTAYKYYDVKSTINGVLQPVPFNSKNRFFLNMSYSSKYDKWEVDYTLQWYGSKRLPDTSDKPVEFQRSNSSPSFFLMNAQISRGFRWGNIYVGSENLSNFVQKNPIVDAENPFRNENGNNFDASMAWAPVAGRMVYFGFRYKIKK
ncbi:MAG: TonB-dependent receptor [Cytophagales bacterium]|nr:TonB-dependent receptor [Cytophagales bacterium]